MYYFKYNYSINLIIFFKYLKTRQKQAKISLTDQNVANSYSIRDKSLDVNVILNVAK